MKNLLRRTILVAAAAVILIPAVFAETEQDLKKALQLVNEGRAAEAVAIIRQAIDREPGSPDAHMALGIAYLESGDTAAAKTALGKAVELNPGSVPVHYLLAMLHEKERNTAAAVAEWKRVLELTRDQDVKDLASKHIRQLEGR